MKKKIASLFMAMALATTSFSGAVFADTTLPVVSVTKAEKLGNNSVYLSGTVTNPAESQELTIIAIKLVAGQAKAENSVYVDQQSSIINDDGTFEMTFNPKVSLDANSEYIVKVGGTNVESFASMKITMGENSEVVEIALGDVTGDGQIDVNDASVALNYVLDSGNFLKNNADGAKMVERMDVFGNKIITAKNVSAILQKALDSSFVFGEKPNKPTDDTTSTETTTSSKVESTTEETEDTTSTEATTSSSSGSEQPDDPTTEGTTNADDIIFNGDALVNCDLAKSNPEKKMYKTINEAISSIKTTPTEDSRFVIDIMPGVYREQVVLSTPYVTLRKNPNYTGEVKHTWYYATGSMYDSIATSGDLKGYYDPNAIGDGEVGIPTHWGASMNVKKQAVGTIFENIVFENSYNEYYTKEELADGLTWDPDKLNSDFDRGNWIKDQIADGKSDDYINKWIQSRTNMNYKGVKGSLRERAAAFYCEADKFEAYGCTFISKQDTMGINSGREYYEDCILSGTVDYICGSANAVFNNCELRFNAGPDMHSDSLSADTKVVADSGHVTAPSNGVGTKGYLFYKCRITGTDDAVPGTLGRPWGQAGGPEAIYYKTVIGKTTSGASLINDDGWADMSGTKKDKARFYEYGSVDENGNSIDTSKRVRNTVAPMGTVINDWQILEFNPYEYTKGSDGWDPMGIKDKYTEFDSIISGITFDSNVTGDITLPTPPSGYEYYWESDTAFATISDDQKTVKVIRPAYGNDSITANLTVYVRKIDTEFGVKDKVQLTILPNETTEGTKNITGKIALKQTADTDVQIQVEAIQNDATVAKQLVTIPAGSTEQAYEVNYLPAGEYEIKVSAITNGYKVIEPEEGLKTVTIADSNIEMNITASALATVTIKTEDFSESWATPTATVADANCTATVVTGTESDTANIGVGNKAIRFTKAEGATVKNTVGFYFDLAKAIKETGGTINNTDSLQFSYDLLLEKDKTATDDGNGYMASDYSYIDFTTKLNNANAANPGRYSRVGIYKNWNQLNFFTATNNKRVNGDNSQFDKNSTMRNRWYKVVTDVDLKQKIITVTLYDRETGTMINKKPYTIATPDVDGNNPEFPTELVQDALYAAVYMDKNGNTNNRIEFYLDNIELTYLDFK